jgi:hypothetical protein
MPSLCSRDRRVFLPPNTTSRLQPLDSGIIASFKVSYKKLLVSKLLNDYENTGRISKLSLKEAVYTTTVAWEKVSATTIKNCWSHTKILTLVDAVEGTLDQQEGELGELDELIEQLGDVAEVGS